MRVGSFSEQIGLFLSVKTVPVIAAGYFSASHISILYNTWNTLHTNTLVEIFQPCKAGIRVRQRCQSRLNKYWKKCCICSQKCVSRSELSGSDPSGESHHWRPLWLEERLVPMGSIHFHLLPPPPPPPAGAAQRLCCVAPKQGLQLQPRRAMGARRKHTRGEQRLVCCWYQFQPDWLSVV